MALLRATITADIGQDTGVPRILIWDNAIPAYLELLDPGCVLMNKLMTFTLPNIVWMQNGFCLHFPFRWSNVLFQPFRLQSRVVISIGNYI